MRERGSPLGFSEPDLNARRIPGLGQEREQRAGWVCWAGLWRAHPGACVEDWCPQVRGGLPCGWGGVAGHQIVCSGTGLVQTGKPGAAWS